MNQEEIKQTQTKKPMPIFGKAILIYIGSIVLDLIVSSPLRKLYRYIEGPYHSDNIGVIFYEGADTFLGGFVWGYVFFIGLLVGLFISRKNWVVWLIGFILIGWISFWELQYFLYSLAFSLLGFLLGKLILEIYKKVKKK